MEREYDDRLDPYSPQPLKPGQPGYRMSTWAPGYDPGPAWNNGVYTPPSGRYDYNNGSPVNDPSQPLQAGYGWEWEGPQQATWDMTTNQWNRGAWQQRKGRGLGYQPAPSGSTPPPGGSGVPAGPGGSAPPQGAGSVPSITPPPPPSTLPGGSSELFNRQPGKTPVQGAYQDALLKFMGRSQEMPSLSDPILGPQAEVFRAQQQRNQERQRLSAAERAAATGQSESGYLDNLIQQGIQEQGFNTAAFNANLLGGEMNKRREELQVALQLANATGNAEAARELQTRLAEASAAMQQQGLNLQGQLGGGDLALRLFQSLMGNDQFYDQLGINTALNLENMNQNAVQRFFFGGR